MSASIKFTVGSCSQDFRITRLKWGFSLSRRSNNSIREVWFSFGREPLRSKQDDYSSRSAYYTLHTGNTFQSYRPKSLDTPLYDSQSDDVYDWNAPCNCGDAFCPTVRAQDSYTPPF